MSIDIISKEMQVDENIAPTYYDLGIVELKLKNKDQACEYFSKSGELGFEQAYKAIKEICN